jgi:hypothetical protein
MQQIWLIQSAYFIFNVALIVSITEGCINLLLYLDKVSMLLQSKMVGMALYFDYLTLGKILLNKSATVIYLLRSLAAFPFQLNHCEQLLEIQLL